MWLKSCLKCKFKAVKKLKLIKVSPGKGKSTATSSPGGGDEAKKEMYLNLLEAELREAKSDKEKALKFVIDMVGKKRFQSFLQEAQDLKSLKKIVRKKLRRWLKLCNKSTISLT